MADIPSTLPDNYVELHQQQAPSHYERVLWKEYPIQSQEVWGVIVDVKKWVATIIRKAEISWATQHETKALKEQMEKRIEIELSPEEIEAIWGKITAIFNWNILIRYEIWENEIIDITKIDINNEFSNLLSKKVSKSYFEKKEDGSIVFHQKDWKILEQNQNDFHRMFYISFMHLIESNPQ